MEMNPTALEIFSKLTALYFKEQEISNVILNSTNSTFDKFNDTRSQYQAKIDDFIGIVDHPGLTELCIGITGFNHKSA